MRFITCTATVAGAVVIIAMAVTSQDSWAGGRDLTSINGSVSTNPGETYDTLSTVNGDVHLKDGSNAHVAKAVNGNITLDANAKAGSARTVNGTLRVRDGAAIEGEAATVNGTVDLGRKVRVGGDVTSVSGNIELDGAEVGGRIETSNGNIELRDGARVQGGITVTKKRDSGWSWGHDADRPVKVDICATCEVVGELRFDRPVVLHVEPGAKIGQVIGDDVSRR
jgi:cytoskeletal protein CcmA (bactofilin family)